jgi:N-acetylglucosaminyl-diphospho-decaprenol L-rhamnosyltransferase
MKATSAGPRVSTVVVSFNTREHLLRCLASLEASLVPLEVVVVDNASADGSAEAVAERFPATRLVRNARNDGFARASNQGLALSRAPYVLLLNSDAEVQTGALEAMLALLEARPRVAAVGPRTLSGDGTVQVSFGPPLTPLHEWRQRRLVQGVRARRPGALRRAAALAAVEHEPAWLSGSCLLARREALAAVGGFDEGFFLYEEDVDLCHRLRQEGWGLVFTPAAEVVHHLGRSMEHAPDRARLEYQRSHVRYYRKHNGRVATLLLRVYLALTAGAGWLSAWTRPGPEGRAARDRQRDTLRVAWSGR